MVFFSSKVSILLFVLTDYGFVLPCVHFVHLALLDHSKPDQGCNDKTKQSVPGVLHCAEESHTTR